MDAKKTYLILLILVSLSEYHNCSHIQQLFAYHAQSGDIRDNRFISQSLINI